MKNSYKFFIVLLQYNKYSLWPLTLFMCLFIFLHLSNLLINNGIAMSIINEKNLRNLAIDHIYENEIFFVFWLGYLLEPIVKIKQAIIILWIMSIFFTQIFLYMLKSYFPS